MGPIDYTSGFGQVNPFASLLQGVQAGAAFANIEQQQAARQMKMQQEAAQFEQQRALDQEFSALASNPRPTFQDYQRVAMRLPADRAKAMLDMFNARTTEQQKSELGFAGNVLAALRSGAPDIGLGLIRERAEAARNGGDEQTAKAYDVWTQLVERDPSRAGATIGLLVSQLPGGDKLLENVGRVGTERRAEEAFVPEQAKRVADAVTAGANAEWAPAVAQATATEAQAKAVTAGAQARVADEAAKLGLQLTRANISNVQSQVGDRAARLRLDADRLALDTTRLLGEIQARAGTIPEAAQKDVNAAAVAAGTATQQASRLNALATELSGLSAWSGAAGSAAEIWKRNFGSQNGATLARQEYARMRNSLVSQSLPPGVASDRDIALAMEGFLPTTANPQVMASFLRGMAKIQGITAEVETARGDWLANNRGSLGRAAQPFQAGRFRTVPGETFAGFTDRVTKELAKPPEGSAARAIEQIPGTGMPSPAAAPRPAQGVSAPPLPPGFAVDRR
jgi:hypothetical protein